MRRGVPIVYIVGREPSSKRGYTHRDPGGDQVTLVEQENHVFVRLLSSQVALDMPRPRSLGVPGI